NKRKFYLALIIFSLVGQIAWVVENMYFNVFIYKMFNASAGDISLMVAASAAAATLTTIFIGALSDRLGRRRIFMCLGYVLWGVSIMAFALVRLDVISALFGSAASAASAAVSAVIVLDCVMTFFGSSANDAAYNAWLTDMTDPTNRGRAEGINSMMPLVAILAVFGGFMGFDLDKAESWTAIYLVIGAVVLAIGILGFFIVDEPKVKYPDTLGYFATIFYGFRPGVMRRHAALYFTLAAFVVFNISIQIFMPYLIIFYEKTLGISNYVLIFAPAIVLAALFTALYGKYIDRHGFFVSVAHPLILLMLGYVILWFFTSPYLIMLYPAALKADEIWFLIPIFIGSLLMLSGFLSGMAVFGAKIRNETPEAMAGRFQGLRIIAQVLIPGVVGPAIGAWVLRDAETIVNSDGTESFLPSNAIFIAALIAAAVLAVGLIIAKAVSKKHEKAV
ncbi:MAG: MFS transporter, partial [Clostridia bacterium]|nr:MFS transporter [Clostridia bacterium]